MSGLSRRLASLASRAGLAGRSAERAQRERQLQLGWRWPLDEPLLRRLERVSLQTSRPAGGGVGGEHRSRARAASTDFADYRHYQPGDDFRQIDWNAYGRLNQLYVKLTEARERLPLYILIDCSASMGVGLPPKLDVARQLVAAVGFVALARFDQLDLVTLGGPVHSRRPLRGKARFGELLSRLDVLQASGAMTLADDVASLRPPSGGRAILVSDLLCETGFEDALAVLDRAGLECCVIQLLAPEELRPEAAGDVELVDLESGELVPVGMTPSAVAEYRRRLQAWCQQAELACGRRRMRYALVETGQPLEQLALVGLRQLGLVR